MAENPEMTKAQILLLQMRVADRENKKPQNDHWHEVISRVKIAKRKSILLHHPELILEEVLSIKGESKCDKVFWFIKKEHMFSYKSRFKVYWDIFVMVLSIYISFAVPYEYCFKDEFFALVPVVILETLIDLIFLVDVIFMFFTGYIDNMGVECFEKDDIALNYIRKARFVIDTLSLIGSKPFQAIHRYISLFGLFKVFRVFRIGQMISHSHVNDENKAMMNMFKLFFYLLLYIHILACGLWVGIEGS